MNAPSVIRDQLLDVLRQRGVAEALRLLNGRVPHRYTGLYQLRDGLLNNQFLIDKQGQVVPAALAAVPLEISFCQFVLRDKSFRSDNTADDRRLDGNPFQGKVMAYHGVPLIDAAGALYGTLCHFDMQPWGISDEEFGNLQLAARLLPEFLSNS